MPAVKGGRVGGYLVFKDKCGNEYRIERYRQGKKEISRGDEALNRFSLITPLVFRNLFAFDLEEMRRFGEISHPEVSSYIYGAGTGVGASRLTAALSSLKKEMEELYKPYGSKPPINQLAAELYQLDREINELQQQPEQFQHLRRRAEELEEVWNRLTAERQQAESRLRRLEDLARTREVREELVRLKRRLAEMPPLLDFPASGLERLNGLLREKEGLAAVRPAGGYSLEEREKALLDLDFNFRRIEQLERELSHLQARRFDLGRQQDLAETEQQISTIFPFWAGGAVVALMGAVSALAFLNNFTLGVVTLLTALFLGGLIAFAGLRAARENARRREVQQRNRQYFSEKLAKVEEDIKKVETALADYRSYSQKLWPVALGTDQGNWDDVACGIQELDREKRVRQHLYYIDQEIAALFKEAGVSSEEEFRRQAERYQETQSLLARIKQQEGILSIIGGDQGEAWERTDEELSGLDEVTGEEERDKLRQTLSELNHQLKKTG